MRERERLWVKGTGGEVGVPIGKRIENLMILGTRGEDKVMGDIGMEGIRIDLMIGIEIGEVGEVISTGGDVQS